MSHPGMSEYTGGVCGRQEKYIRNLEDRFLSDNVKVELLYADLKVSPLNKPKTIDRSEFISVNLIWGDHDPLARFVPVKLGVSLARLSEKFVVKTKQYK